MSWRVRVLVRYGDRSAEEEEQLLLGLVTHTPAKLPTKEIRR